MLISLSQGKEIITHIFVYRVAHKDPDALFDVTRSPERKYSNFKSAFNYYILGLSVEVNIVFLGQLAWKWQHIKVQSPKKIYGNDEFY